MTDDGPRDRYPILGNGEVYVEPIKKGKPGPPRRFPRSYEEARTRLLSDVETLRKEMASIPQSYRLKDTVVACIRQHPWYLAKTYHPDRVFTSGAFTELGSKRWYPANSLQENTTAAPEFGKLFYVGTSDDQLALFTRLLERPESAAPPLWVQDIRRIESLGLPLISESIIGFPTDWSGGLVELILHPFPEDERDEAIGLLTEIMQEHNVDLAQVKVRPYPGGPTFLSAQVTPEALRAFGGFNPLRTAHPLRQMSIPSLRESQTALGPQAPSATQRSQIVVGVFDGGAIERHPLLEPFVTVHNDLMPKPTPEDMDYLLHGTAVTGAVLYGPLNDYGRADRLPTPPVSVEVFRVIRSQNSSPDPYDTIDLVEKVVSERRDIKVFNLSFGPPGAIVDEDVSRFTYALDRLAHPDRALFTVAVGNDGDLPKPLGRIQAPSDAVNAVGVGAFTFDGNGKPIRAPYSCIGAGREGCKLKPDLVAFGGSDQRPIHLVGQGASKWLAWGTSFAAPLVARRAAELLGRCDRMTPLVARALLVHTATHPRRTQDHELGHGLLADSVDDILRCPANRVTVLFQNSMYPSKCARLPIPLPMERRIRGLVRLKWTIALTTPVHPEQPDDYTDCCLEDSFHPHKNKYRFSNPLNQKEFEIVDIVEQPETVERLLSQGWQQSIFPHAEPARRQTEKELRGNALKWDTVVRKTRNLKPSSLNEPCIVLHSMARNGANSELEYAVAITIDVPGYEGSLYDDILAVYNRLEPLRIRSLNEVMVTVA